MRLKITLWFVLACFVILIPLHESRAASKKKSPAPYPSITGKVALVETERYTKVIQVARRGRKEGLRSVRALVNDKTEIIYLGKKIPISDVTKGSTVRLDYERVKKGIIVARKIVLITPKKGEKPSNVSTKPKTGGK